MSKLQTRTLFLSLPAFDSLPVSMSTPMCGLDAHSAVLRCELGAFSHALFFTFVWPRSTFFSFFLPSFR